MEIKPVQLKGVQPISVKPVQAVKPAIQLKQQEAGSETPDDVFSQLFGGNSDTDAKPATEVTKEERQAEIKGAVAKVEAKNKKKAKAKSEAEEDEEDGEEEVDEEETKSKKGKAKEKKYTGPREVRVYGLTLWTEEDDNVTLEQIRKRIETEFHYPEFSASRTVMSIDENTGIVVPDIKFEKKG